MNNDKKERFNNYYNCLIELRKEIQKGGFTNISPILTKHKVSKSLTSLLILHGVIWKADGFYHWNIKIPPSMALVKKMIEEVDESIKFFNTERNRRIEVAAKMNNKPARKPIQKKKQTVKKQPIQKVGLIRRFIRWIY